jgi:hypothetical protein
MKILRITGEEDAGVRGVLGIALAEVDALVDLDDLVVLALFVVLRE